MMLISGKDRDDYLTNAAARLDKSNAHYKLSHSGNNMAMSWLIISMIA